MTPGPAVLVTGATGFVGRHVARRLLRAGARVVALARGGPGEPAPVRVGRAVGVAAAGPRLTVVAGDLAAPRVGLDVTTLERLRREVDAVVHCGGDPTFEPADPAVFRAGHVTGPRSLLEALAGARPRRWVQVSTAFVCGSRAGVVREDEGDVGQTFHNTYERVKLEAEGVLRAAGAAAGLEVVVARPSVVVGVAPGTPGGAPSDLLLDFIRMIAAAGELGGAGTFRVAAAPSAPFNIVPVGRVAAALAALALAPERLDGPLHLVVSDPPSQAALLAMIVRRLGVPGPRLVDAGPGGIPDATPFEQGVARALAPYQRYLEQRVRLDDTRARGVLSALGVRPARLDRSAVHRLVAAALGPRSHHRRAFEVAG